jgi:formyltetrahydrofolate synthetase
MKTSASGKNQAIAQLCGAVVSLQTPKSKRSWRYGMQTGKFPICMAKTQMSFQ